MLAKQKHHEKALSHAKHHHKAMDKVKIKRAKRAKKKIGKKEKALAALGVGGSLLGAAGAVAPKSAETQFVRTQETQEGGTTSKIKDMLKRIFGVSKAQAFEDDTLEDDASSEDQADQEDVAEEASEESAEEQAPAEEPAEQPGEEPAAEPEPQSEPEPEPQPEEPTEEPTPEPEPFSPPDLPGDIGGQPPPSITDEDKQAQKGKGEGKGTPRGATTGTTATFNTGSSTTASGNVNYTFNVSEPNAQGQVLVTITVGGVAYTSPPVTGLDDAAYLAWVQTFNTGSASDQAVFAAAANLYYRQNQVATISPQTPNGIDTWATAREWTVDAQGNVVGSLSEFGNDTFLYNPATGTLWKRSPNGTVTNVTNSSYAETVIGMMSGQNGFTTAPGLTTLKQSNTWLPFSFLFGQYNQPTNSAVHNNNDGSNYPLNPMEMATPEQAQLLLQFFPGAHIEEAALAAAGPFFYQYAPNDPRRVFNLVLPDGTVQNVGLILNNLANYGPDGLSNLPGFVMTGSFNLPGGLTLQNFGNFGDAGAHNFGWAGGTVGPGAQNYFYNPGEGGTGVTPGGLPPGATPPLHYYPGGKPAGQPGGGGAGGVTPGSPQPGGGQTPEPAPLTITTATLPSARIGQAYTATLRVSGATSASRIMWQVSAGTFPSVSGLSLDPLTGVISGTPLSQPGTYTFTVVAMDLATQRTASKQFTLVIEPAPPPARVIQESRAEEEADEEGREAEAEDEGEEEGEEGAEEESDEEAKDGEKEADKDQEGELDLEEGQEEEEGDLDLEQGEEEEGEAGGGKEAKGKEEEEEGEEDEEKDESEEEEEEGEEEEGGEKAAGQNEQAIKDLRGQITQLESKIAELSGKISAQSSSSELAAARNEIASLRQQISDLTAAINRLQQGSTVRAFDAGGTQGFQGLRMPAGYPASGGSVGLQMPAGYPASSGQAQGVNVKARYTVKKGDTLWAIAKRYYGDGKKWRKILEANLECLSRPGNTRTLKIGFELQIPE